MKEHHQALELQKMSTEAKIFVPIFKICFIGKEI
jgi:hypothetical protein